MHVGRPGLVDAETIKGPVLKIAHTMAKAESELVGEILCPDTAGIVKFMATQLFAPGKKRRVGENFGLNVTKPLRLWAELHINRKNVAHGIILSFDAQGPCQEHKTTALGVDGKTLR